MTRFTKKLERLSVFLFLLLICIPILLWPWATGGSVSDLLDMLGRRRTLAEARQADGHVFRVVQYWNGIDFYTTELIHLSPQEHAEHVFPVDADDVRRVRVGLTVDEGRKTAQVIFNRDRRESVTW